MQATNSFGDHSPRARLLDIVNASNDERLLDALCNAALAFLSVNGEGASSGAACTSSCGLPPDDVHRSPTKGHPQNKGASRERPTQQRETHSQVTAAPPCDNTATGRGTASGGKHRPHVYGSGPSPVLRRQYERYSLRPGSATSSALRHPGNADGASPSSTAGCAIPASSSASKPAATTSQTSPSSSVNTSATATRHRLANSTSHATKQQPAAHPTTTTAATASPSPFPPTAYKTPETRVLLRAPHATTPATGGTATPFSYKTSQSSAASCSGPTPHRTSTSHHPHPQHTSTTSVARPSASAARPSPSSGARRPGAGGFTPVQYQPRGLAALRQTAAASVTPGGAITGTALSSRHGTPTSVSCGGRLGAGGGVGVRGAGAG
ncbi:hypothetical protein Agub_g4991, partial [Astrephomene gubernaculifera]